MASSAQIYMNDFYMLKDIDWNFPDNLQDDISQIHPYPARFIESLPRTLINMIGCPASTAVLDPFCGSGTTLLESQRANIPSVGIDLNPIAGLISRVKTQVLAGEFLSIAEQISIEAKAKLNRKLEIPQIPNLDHWFSREVQHAIASIVATIHEISSVEIKDALNFCLSSLIVRFSNQDSDTRYAAVENTSTIDDVFSGFISTFERLWKAKKATSFNTKTKIIIKDILKVSEEDIDYKIGLVITSPPYPNAYEYWLYHKYRMWWLGYNPISVRESEIGARPHYHKKNGQTEVDFSIQMDKVFSLLSRCVIPGGVVCFVIGRSIIRGRYIDNAQIICNVALKWKFSLAANIEREIQTSRKSFNLSYGKINKENILILRKDA